MFKTLFLAAIVAAATAPAPAMAQSPFDGFGEPEDPAKAEMREWKRAAQTQIYEHTPSFTTLGHGRAKVNFCVDASGRVVKEKLGDYSGNGHALLAASIVSSLKLPPAPPTVKAKIGKDCLWFYQDFWFE